MSRSRFQQPKRKRGFRCCCRKCQHREFMERHPDTYSRGLECKSCGHRAADRGDGWRVDWYRTSKAEAKRQGVCECMDLPFPHRGGSKFKSVRCSSLISWRNSHRAQRVQAAA